MTLLRVTVYGRSQRKWWSCLDVVSSGGVGSLAQLHTESTRQHLSPSQSPFTIHCISPSGPFSAKVMNANSYTPGTTLAHAQIPVRPEHHTKDCHCHTNLPLLLGSSSLWLRQTGSSQKCWFPALLILQVFHFSSPLSKKPFWKLVNFLSCS